MYSDAITQLVPQVDPIVVIAFITASRLKVRVPPPAKKPTMKMV